MRTFETLDNFIRDAKEELSTGRDMEISDRIKKESKKNFSKDRKDIPTAVSNFNRGKRKFPEGASPGSVKKSGVQLRKSRTSRMWNVLSATTKDIMLIIARNLRQKTRKELKSTKDR